MKTHHKPIENIVFQGGGAKGIAYTGAIDTLMEHIHLSQVQHIAGTSFGAILSALLCVGYTPDELHHELEKTPILTLLDAGSLTTSALLKAKNVTQSTRGMVQNAIGNQTIKSTGESVAGSIVLPILPNLIYQLSQHTGVCEGEKFRKWIEQLLFEKTGIPHLTFDELRQRQEENPEKYKALYVTGSDVTTQTLKIFSGEHTPNVIISDAVRISIALPFLFRPHSLWEKNLLGERVRSETNTADYIDGGVAQNYPVNLFDDYRYRQHHSEEERHQDHNARTLGFRLCEGEKPLEPYEGPALLPTPDRDSLITALRSLFAEALNQQRYDFYRYEKTRERTIDIHTGSVKTFDFDLTSAKKIELIAAGREAVQQHFSKHNRTICMTHRFFNSASIDEKISIINKNYSFSHSDWLVSILHDNGFFGGHALLLVEGLFDNPQQPGTSQLFVGQYDILALDYKTLYLEYGLPISDDLINASYFNSKGLIWKVRCFEAMQYGRDYSHLYGAASYFVGKQDAIRMIESIKDDQANAVQLSNYCELKVKTPEDNSRILELINDESLVIKYQALGKNNILKDKGEGGINCADWCLQKAAMAGIDVDDNALSKPKVAANTTCNIL